MGGLNTAMGTTSDELARWRAAKARSSPSPMIARRSTPVAANHTPASVAAPAAEPANDPEDAMALLEGCTSVQVESIATSSDGSRDNGVNKAVDGSASTFYTTQAEPGQPVEIQLMLAGRYQVRKIDILWKHAPTSFSIQFSKWDGERFVWTTAADKLSPDGTRPQEVFIGHAGFSGHTGAVKLLVRPEADGLFGISDIQIFG